MGIINLACIDPGRPLPIYAQDPAYSKVDKEFLTRYLNFNIVNDPDGFAMIDDKTFVFDIGTILSYVYMNTSGPHPAAMINIHPMRLEGDATNAPRNIKEVATRNMEKYDHCSIGGCNRHEFLHGEMRAWEDYAACWWNRNVVR